MFNLFETNHLMDAAILAHITELKYQGYIIKEYSAFQKEPNSISIKLAISFDDIVTITEFFVDSKGNLTTSKPTFVI